MYSKVGYDQNKDEIWGAYRIRYDNSCIGAIFKLRIPDVQVHEALFGVRTLEAGNKWELLPVTEDWPKILARP